MMTATMSGLGSLSASKCTKTRQATRSTSFPTSRAGDGPVGLRCANLLLQHNALYEFALSAQVDVPLIVHFEVRRVDKTKRPVVWSVRDLRGPGIDLYTRFCSLCRRSRRCSKTAPSSISVCASKKRLCQKLSVDPVGVQPALHIQLSSVALNCLHSSICCGHRLERQDESSPVQHRVADVVALCVASEQLYDWYAFQSRLSQVGIRVRPLTHPTTVSRNAALLKLVEHHKRNRKCCHSSCSPR